MGPQLMEDMREQSINCGAEIITETVEKINLQKCAFQCPSSGVHPVLILPLGAKRLSSGGGGQATEPCVDQVP